MDYLTHQLLEQSAVKKLVEQLLQDKASWEDGKKTAGSYASLQKNNLQLNRKSKTSIEISESIRNKMKSNPLIKSYSLPRQFHGINFTRTGEEQGYGYHVDNPYMSSGRSDLSFTLFLNEPEDYQGGELSIQTIQTHKEIKLPAGYLVIYPSTSLHSVKKVTKGERLVCIGWIQSYIRSNEDRNLLFGIDAGAKGLLAEHGRSPQLDLIFQAYSNLVRRLGD